jgi:hypothetical protein
MLPPCAQCGAVLLEGARFCGSCGVAIPEVLEEDAAALARYRAVLDRFLQDGPLKSHELEQLEALRQRLSISVRTHERLCAELLPGRAEAGERASLRLFLDTETVRHFMAGARCVLRIKLVNDGPLLLESVCEQRAERAARAGPAQRRERALHREGRGRNVRGPLRAHAGRPRDAVPRAGAAATARAWSSRSPTTAPTTI